jgi:hypothetical protein
MTRTETIQLVSRALACIQFIEALLDASYLPPYFVRLHGYVQLAHSGDSSAARMVSLGQLEIGLYFARIAFLLLITAIFWNCGPWISRCLMPETRSGAAPTPTSEIKL